MYLHIFIGLLIHLRIYWEYIYITKTKGELFLLSRLHLLRGVIYRRNTSLAQKTQGLLLVEISCREIYNSGGARPRKPIIHQQRKFLLVTAKRFPGRRLRGLWLQGFHLLDFLHYDIPPSSRTFHFVVSFSWCPQLHREGISALPGFLSSVSLLWGKQSVSPLKRLTTIAHDEK